MLFPPVARPLSLVWISLRQLMLFAVIALASTVDCGFALGQQEANTPMLLEELSAQMEVNSGYLQIKDHTINANDLAYLLQLPGNPEYKAPFIDLDNVNVLGQVTLFGGDPPSIISEGLNCTNCHFQGGINVTKCSIIRGFVFDNCQLSLFSATSSQFNLLNFRSCRLASIILANVTRSGSVQIVNCHSGLSIFTSEFNGPFIATGDDTDLMIVCSGSKFHDLVSLEGSHATISVQFFGNTLDRDCNLSNVETSSFEIWSNTFSGGFYAASGGGGKNDNKGTPQTPQNTQPAQASQQVPQAQAQIQPPTQPSKIVIRENIFKGQVSLASSKAAEITISPTNSEDKLQRTSLLFEKGFDLEDVRCDRLKIERADFADRAIFSGMQTEMFTLENVVFRGLVDLENAKFKANLSNVRFEKGVEANWSQFETRDWVPFMSRLSTKCDSRTWRSLSNAFKETGDLFGQNAAYYQERLTKRLDHDPDENPFWNTFSQVIWGYGVRPVRLFGWLVLITVAFAVVYSFALEAPQPQHRWERVKTLLIFSAQRIWSLEWNPKDAVGPWKAVALAQSVLSKVILICLAQALANISPLLHDIFGKFVNF